LENGAAVLEKQMQKNIFAAQFNSINKTGTETNSAALYLYIKSKQKKRFIAENYF